MAHQVCYDAPAKESPDAFSLENPDPMLGGAVHTAAMGVSVGATASDQK
jgi:hypothetical protein